MYTSRILILIFMYIPNILCDCSWPSNLQNSMWHDSDKGQLNFDTKTMSGLDYTVSGTIIENWDCFVEISSSGIVIMRSQDTFTIFNIVYRPFLCINLTAITDYSYYYYIQGAREMRLGNERITPIEEAQVASITETNAESMICRDFASYTEYHVLVKDSQEDNAAQACPSLLQEEFWCEVNEGGTTSCGTKQESWNVCKDTKTMEFNYTTCSTQIAYSNGGIVRCIATLSTGTYTLTTVMNTDLVPTTMFTCFMAQLSQTGVLQVSQSPRSYTEGQTPTTQPEHPDGSKGLLLELTPHATSACGTTTTSPTTTSTTSTTTSTTTTPTTTATTTATTPASATTSSSSNIITMTLILAILVIQHQEEV